METPKFQLGQEVTVEYVGKITEVEINTLVELGKEVITYTITGEGGRRSYNVREENIYPLPLPKEEE